MREQYDQLAVLAKHPTGQSEQRMHWELWGTAQSPHYPNTLQTGVYQCFTREVKNKEREMGEGGGSTFTSQRSPYCFVFFGSFVRFALAFVL